TLNQQRLCNGTGTCQNGSTLSCGAFACINSACATSCTSQAQCSSAGFCDLVSGTCKLKKADGTACMVDTDCQNAHCVDNVCCAPPCTGVGRACPATKRGRGVDGVCGPILAGLAPDNECADMGSPACSTNGVCDGMGACQLYTSGTQCTASACQADGVTLN